MARGRFLSLPSLLEHQQMLSFALSLRASLWNPIEFAIKRTLAFWKQGSRGPCTPYVFIPRSSIGRRSIQRANRVALSATNKRNRWRRSVRTSSRWTPFNQEDLRNETIFSFLCTWIHIVHDTMRGFLLYLMRPHGDLSRRGRATLATDIPLYRIIASLLTCFMHFSLHCQSLFFTFGRDMIRYSLIHEICR